MGSPQSHAVMSAWTGVVFPAHCRSNIESLRHVASRLILGGLQTAKLTSNLLRPHKKWPGTEHTCFKEESECSYPMG